MSKLALLVFVAGLALVEPHFYMREPLARTSLQTQLHRFPNAQQPFWWDHTGVWCGNQNQNEAVSTCGRCGDAPGQSHANQGGRYDKNVITATYNAGQQIAATVSMHANHRGQIIFQLCANANESDGCFTHRLNVASADRGVQNNAACTGNDQQNGTFGVRINLPANVRCTRCTLRATYRTSYPPAPNACHNPNPAQTFRNCVDIRIN